MKNGNASCAFSTKFSKLILLTLNVGHLFIYLFCEKNGRIFKKYLLFFDDITDDSQTSTFLWKNYLFSNRS